MDKQDAYDFEFLANFVHSKIEIRNETFFNIVNQNFLLQTVVAARAALYTPLLPPHWDMGTATPFVVIAPGICRQSKAVPVPAVLKLQQFVG